jgi:hypothetical protein
MPMSEYALDFYAQPSFLTDPGPHAGLFSALPDNVRALCRVVQGLLIHPYWAGAYGYAIPKERASEYQIRGVAGKLERILELEDRPLLEPRSPERRLVGNCRDYAVLLTAMLRNKGIPVRTRCGFGAFVDAQLDDVQREALRIPFDPCDVPRDQFLPGGRAWLMCRHSEADPDTFGYGDTVGGLPNIRGNLVRDVAFLNRVEILGWDYWGLIEGDEADLDEEDLGLLDEAATLSLAGNDRFPELRSLYLSDMRLRVPRIVKRYDDESFTCEDILDGDSSLAKYL